MTRLTIMSESQVQGVFDTLGLEGQQAEERPVTPPQPMMNDAPHTGKVILPRLSNSSVPPPTGTVSNADLERHPRRS